EEVYGYCGIEPSEVRQAGGILNNSVETPDLTELRLHGLFLMMDRDPASGVSGQHNASDLGGLLVAARLVVAEPGHHVVEKAGPHARFFEDAHVRRCPAGAGAGAHRWRH